MKSRCKKSHEVDFQLWIEKVQVPELWFFSQICLSPTLCMRRFSFKVEAGRDVRKLIRDDPNIFLNPKKKLKSQKKYFKLQCFWEIIIKHFIKSKNLLDPYILFYKSEITLKIQESWSNPEKYLGNRKKYFVTILASAVVSQRQRYSPLFAISKWRMNVRKEFRII